MDKFELNTTVQFTFVSSVAPGSAPAFGVEDRNGTLVQSFSSIQSDSTHYYTLLSVNSEGVWTAVWRATKTFNGSARDFYKRIPFAVGRTKGEP